ncbi:MAG TPA: OsmC family protein [Candidatus Thermoplasmatota archaeon]|nr:OsmC family protein [Candidatus Thermoplasmatota archaeon]
MKVIVKQVQGLSFVGKGESNHWVSIDGPKQFNGSEAGSRPMELLLVSLGSCTASDVASILQKKRVPLDSMDVIVTGERKETHPKVYTKINIEYVFYGKNMETKDLERAIDLSQNKYCPISAMLKESCEITHSYQLKEKKE